MLLSKIKSNPNNPRLITCHNCGIDFTSNKLCKSRQPKYCSKKCYAQSIIKYKICPVCSKQFPSDPNTKFCSIECYKTGRVSRKGQALSESIAGLVLSFLIQLWIYPLLNIPVTINQNIFITFVFFLASFLRSYAVRRIFNKFSEKAVR